MRVVFMGTPEFAVPTLEAVVRAGHEVVLVVSQPDKPAGRGQVVRPPPVVEKAQALGLPVAQPRAIKSGAFPEQLKALAPDVALVLAYGRILPADLLATPKHGCVNVHASLLPRWRGAAPIQWAIWHGDAETGVCTQQMEVALDTGPIFHVRKTPIVPRETAGQLHDRLSLLAAEVAVETLGALPDAVSTPQDHAAATYCGKLDKDMGKVDWNAPADAIDRQVRAMTPWPGGWVPYADGALKLLEVRVAEDPNMPWTQRRYHTIPRWDARAAGTVLATNPLVVKAGDTGLELVQVQAPGRRAVSGAEFANGARLQTGGSL